MTPVPLPELSLQSANYTADHWLPRESGDFLDLDAPYQRGFVWSDDQRRNLIKSLVMGLPIGTSIIAFIGYGHDKHDRVVDGKQRITTIRAFFASEFTVPGWWFTEADCPAGWRASEVRYDQLTQRGQRSLANHSVPSMTFDSTFAFVENPAYDPVVKDSPRWSRRERTPEQMLQAEAELYLLVNFGGVDQTESDRERAALIAGVL